MSTLHRAWISTGYCTPVVFTVVIFWYFWLNYHKNHKTWIFCHKMWFPYHFPIIIMISIDFPIISPIISPMDSRLQWSPRARAIPCRHVTHFALTGEVQGMKGTRQGSLRSIASLWTPKELVFFHGNPGVSRGKHLGNIWETSRKLRKVPETKWIDGCLKITPVSDQNT